MGHHWTLSFHGSADGDRESQGDTNERNATFLTQLLLKHLQPLLQNLRYDILQHLPVAAKVADVEINTAELLCSSDFPLSVLIISGSVFAQTA